MNINLCTMIYPQQSNSWISIAKDSFRRRPAEISVYLFRESTSQADMLACQFDDAREPKLYASVIKTQMKNRTTWDFSSSLRLVKKMLLEGKAGEMYPYQLIFTHHLPWNPSPINQHSSSLPYFNTQTFLLVLYFLYNRKLPTLKTNWKCSNQYYPEWKYKYHRKWLVIECDCHIKPNWFCHYCY